MSAIQYAPPASASYRRVRGGSWSLFENYCTVAYRGITYRCRPQQLRWFPSGPQFRTMKFPKREEKLEG